MSFIWAGRLDDELQWRWNQQTSPAKQGPGVFVDDFRKKWPERLSRGPESGRAETRVTAGTQWSITSGASWDEGDLLRLNDPDNDDFDLRELTSISETAIAVAAGAVVSGAALGPETNYPPIVNVEGTNTFGQSNVMLFRTTDVNSVTPITAHEGTEASLDNSSGWQIDVTGSGDVEIVRVDTVRNIFIVKLLPAQIQENPHV